MQSKIRYLFRIFKYPKYFTDIVLVFFYKIYWNFKGVDIGHNVKLMGIPIITVKEKVQISIGDDCVLCSRVSDTALGVSRKIIIRTLKEGANIYIGDGVRMSGTTICADKNVSIGSRCVIGADVIIADTDFHSMDYIIRSTPEDHFQAISIPTKIGADTFIGARTIILKGVEIGKGSIIGAGSIVTKSFEDHAILAGNPAKIIGYTSAKSE